MTSKGGDEAVWFSALCAAFAFMASKSYPSTAMSMIFILMLCWTFWSLYKMLLGRL
jgi:hypothetical protein